MGFGYPTRIESGSLTLRGEMGASFLWFVGMTPLWLGGLKGKESTPSIGKEVPVRSQQLASKSWTKRKHETTTLDSMLSVTVRVLNLH